MSTTSNSSLLLRNGQSSDINLMNHNVNNVIPPLPKKKQIGRTLSKKKSVNISRVNEDSGHRSRINSPQTESMKKQAGIESIQMVDMQVFCTDIPNYGCLTPTDPPTNNVSHERSLIHTSSSTTGTITRRVDSGIGFASFRGPENVNCSASIPASPTSVLSVSHLSAQYDLPYEDIDHYNRIHDDQRHPSRGQQVQSHISGVPDDSTHTYLQFNTKRCSDASEQRSSQSGANCWIGVSLTVILIVSMAAVCLSIYQLASPSSKTRQIPQHLSQALSKIEMTVNDLVQEKEAFKDALRIQETHLTSLTEDKILPVSTQLTNLTAVVKSMRDKCEAQIVNTSFTLRPQGEPGVVNYSLCVSQSVTKSAPASATAITETSLLPSLTDIQVD